MSAILGWLDAENEDFVRDLVDTMVMRHEGYDRAIVVATMLKAGAPDRRGQEFWSEVLSVLWKEAEQQFDHAMSKLEH